MPGIDTKQHTIPQFYLREFSSDQKNIYRYDKQAETAPEHLPIKAVQCHKGFYDIGRPNQKDGFVDEYLTNFEKWVAPKFQEALTRLDEGRDIASLMEVIAVFIVVSYLRSEPMRDWADDFHKKITDFQLGQPTFREDAINELRSVESEATAEEIDAAVDMLESTIKDIQPSMLQASLLLFNEFNLQEDYYRSLLQRKWILYQASPDLLNYGFWTSDNPVVWYPNRKLLPGEGLGAMTTHTDIIFPLSKKYCLILPGDSWKDSPTWNRKIFFSIVNKEKVDQVNQRQYLRAARFVYPCSSNYFLIRSLRSMK